MKVMYGPMDLQLASDLVGPEAAYSSMRRMEVEEEYRRLRSLQSYYLLDSDGESNNCYARIAAMSARFLRAQVARIVLVDMERYWTVASSVRRDEAQTEFPRMNSIYERNVIMGQVCVIPDLDVINNSQFVKNFHGKSALNFDGVATSNLSHKAPPSRIRFYAGFPLINQDGHVLGVLAVLDENPRACLPNVQIEVLQDMAKSVVDLMEEKRKQLFSGVNPQPFQPGLLRSARFVSSKLESMGTDRELQSMMHHHQARALDSAILSARYLSVALKPNQENYNKNGKAKCTLCG